MLHRLSYTQGWGNVLSHPQRLRTALLSFPPFTSWGNRQQLSHRDVPGDVFILPEEAEIKQASRNTVPPYSTTAASCCACSTVLCTGSTPRPCILSTQQELRADFFSQDSTRGLSALHFRLLGPPCSLLTPSLTLHHPKPR